MLSTLPPPAPSPRPAPTIATVLRERRSPDADRELLRAARVAAWCDIGRQQLRARLEDDAVKRDRPLPTSGIPRHG